MGLGEDLRALNSLLEHLPLVRITVMIMMVTQVPTEVILCKVLLHFLYYLVFIAAI